MLEKRKKMKFSIEKSKYMTINQNKQDTTLHSTVYKCSIKQTADYKYMGNYISEKGADDLNIKKRKQKLNYALPATLSFSNHGNVGTEYISICLKLMESTLIPMILADSETWTNLSEGNTQDIENM